MELDTESVIKKAEQLLDDIQKDEQLRKDATVFVTHVKDFSIPEPVINEDTGTSVLYMKVATDVCQVGIPIMITVNDVSTVRAVSNGVHVLVKDYLLQILKDAFDSMKDSVHGVSDFKSVKNVAMPVIYSVMGNVLTIVTDDDFNSLLETISNYVTNIELISNPSDERTYELVDIDIVDGADKEEVHKIVLSMLNFINRLWEIFIMPIISNI